MFALVVTVLGAGYDIQATSPMGESSYALPETDAAQSLPPNSGESTVRSQAVLQQKAAQMKEDKAKRIEKKVDRKVAQTKKDANRKQQLAQNKSYSMERRIRYFDGRLNSYRSLLARSEKAVAGAQEKIRVHRAKPNPIQAIIDSFEKTIYDEQEKATRYRNKIAEFQQKKSEAQQEVAAVHKQVQKAVKKVEKVEGKAAQVKARIG